MIASTPNAAKLAAALDANPDTTATALAAVAGIGKSTAAKMLAEWEKSGDAARAEQAKGAATWRNARQIQEAIDAAHEAAAAQAAKVVAPAEPVTVNKTGQTRLVRGALRAEVMEWLYANPEADITPSKMGKALGGRSGGACQGVLRVLTAEGITDMVSESPKTYRLHAV